MVYFRANGTSFSDIADQEIHCMNYGIMYLHPGLTMTATIMELNSGVTCVTHKENCLSSPTIQLLSFSASESIETKTLKRK